MAQVAKRSLTMNEPYPRRDMHCLPILFPITFPVTCPQQSQVTIKQRHWHLFLSFISIKFESDLFHEHINSYLKPSWHMRKYQSNRTSEKSTSMRSSNNFYNINIFLVVISWVEKRTYLQNKNAYITYGQTLYMVYS